MISHTVSLFDMNVPHCVIENNEFALLPANILLSVIPLILFVLLNFLQQTIVAVVTNRSNNSILRVRLM